MAPVPVELRQRAVRGTILSIANQGGKVLASTGTLLVAGYYLSSTELGVVAIGFSIQAMINLLRDAGFADAFVQKSDADDDDANTLFWVQLGLIAFISASLALAAPWIADAYDNEDLTLVLWSLVPALIAQAFASIQAAQFRRRLDFKHQMGSDLASTLLGAVLAVAMLATGFGLWSLIARFVVDRTLFAALCWGFSSWRPSLKWSFSSLKRLWSFASYRLLTSFLGRGIAQLDELILGRLLGLSEAGTFFMAKTLGTAVPRELVGATGLVMFPTFSAIQKDLPRLRTGLLEGCRALATLMFPVTVAIVVAGPDFLRALWGDRWIHVIEPMQVLAFVGVMQALSMPANQLLTALGRMRFLFLVRVLTACGAVVALVIGSRWGLLGVAYGWIAARAVDIPLVGIPASRACRIPFSEVLAAFIRPSAAALLAGSAGYLVGEVLRDMSVPGGGLALVAAELLVGMTVYLAACWLLLRSTVRMVFSSLVPKL